MIIKQVETLEDLKELYDSSAMTWEGLAKEYFELAMDKCCAEGKDGTGYVTKGKVMNKLCQLTGPNAYPDDLTIFSIKDFKGLAIFYGARWMDDIISNNARREKWNPFEEGVYENYE